jgi:aminoglycoside phosphotransferase (APT) family kinase protein
MRKADITADLVSRLIADQTLQWAGLPVRPVEADGVDNTTFRLGPTMSVRLPSADVYVEQVDKEHRWLPVLAGQLPLPIPEPLARGVPGNGFPRPWSVYRWIDGDPATAEGIADMPRFAADLADFLVALYQIDPAGGPGPGTHNFFRGGPVAVYDGETQDALAALQGQIDTALAAEVWRAALRATWQGPPVWFHGDAQPGNLLLRDGRLSAVIDFGTSGVGDPACDTTIAWTFLSGESSRIFKQRLPSRTTRRTRPTRRALSRRSSPITPQPNSRPLAGISMIKLTYHHLRRALSPDYPDARLRKRGKVAAGRPRHGQIAARLHP